MAGYDIDGVKTDQLSTMVALNRRFSEAEFRRLWARQDMTAYRVAEALGCGATTAIKRAKRLGLPDKPKGYRAQVDTNELRTLWLLGISRAEIAAHLGITGSWVCRLAAALGLPPRGRGARPRMTLAAYRETLLAKAMAETARIEQRQIKLAEMWDQPGHNTSGKRKAA